MDVPTKIHEFVGRVKQTLPTLQLVSERYVLYTDTDVVFTRDPVAALFRLSKEMLGVVAYSSENSADSRRPRNTGVMLIDTERLAPFVPEMVELGRSRGFQHSVYDQELFNEVLRDRHQVAAWLPVEFNWKGYWGRENLDGIYILHYHGDKPFGRGPKCVQLGLMQYSPDKCQLPPFRMPGCSHLLKRSRPEATMTFDRNNLHAIQIAVVNDSFQHVRLHFDITEDDTALLLKEVSEHGGPWWCPVLKALPPFLNPYSSVQEAQRDRVSVTVSA